MSGLSEGSVYEYKIENRSDVFNFTFRHAHQPGRVTKHIIFGDMGSAHAYSLCLACTGDVVCNSSTCATNNTDVGLIAETDADMFLHLGDFACTLQRLQALFILEQTLTTATEGLVVLFLFVLFACTLQGLQARFVFLDVSRHDRQRQRALSFLFLFYSWEKGFVTMSARHYECSSL
jgi:hypothetical protein